MKYEYSCPACGNVVAIYRPITDIEVEYDCPNNECGSTLNRKYEAPAITFRGKGFYTTDKD